MTDAAGGTDAVTDAAGGTDAVTAAAGAAGAAAAGAAGVVAGTSASDAPVLVGGPASAQARGTAPGAARGAAPEAARGTAPGAARGAAPELVLFDLDDTLFAHRAAVAAGILGHVSAQGGRGAAADPHSVVTLWHALEEQHYHAYLAGELDFAGQRSARARDFAAAHGVDLTAAEAAAWFTDYFAHYRANWRLHDDALPCLDELARRIPGVRFGLITNGELAYQSVKLADTGLDARVEHVVASAEFGLSKPRPEIFRHACTLFDVDPRASVYVGDRLRTDAIGAAGAGLTGVWLDRVGTAGPPPPAADLAEARELGVIRLTTLAALPAALTA
jgi:putative hydrolase of the HAD superfamily